MNLPQVVAVELSGLLLAWALSLAPVGAVDAEEARPAAAVAPAPDPCSKVEVERALAALGEDELFELSKVRLEDENDDPYIFGTAVGRFLDPACHVALVGVGELHFGSYYFMKTAMLLKLFEGRLKVVKRLSTAELDETGDCGVRLEEVVDFDHDGRDEVVTSLALVNTRDASDHHTGTVFQLLGVRGGKLASLWNSDLRRTGWWVVNECRSEKGPCETGSVDYVLVDLDGDGTDEVVLSSKRAEYSDPEHRKQLTSDSRRDVFWYDGAGFTAWRPARPIGPAAANPALPVPAGAVARFQARLSTQDYFNGQTGAPLKFAAQVIRQDRVNYHVAKTPDAEDTADSVYGAAGARGALTDLLERALSPTESGRIIRGTPLVDVTVWTDRAEVLILSE